jgi:hypothetical protein
VLLRETGLAGAGTVMQSFSFDNANRWIIAAQIRDRARGDLRLSRLTLDGELDAEMTLRGFGHGGQIGVVPDGTGSHVWVESSPADENGTAWGTRVARVRFVDGGEVEAGSGDVEEFDLVPGARRVTCAVDPRSRRLAVRFQVDGGPRFRVYDLDQVAAGGGSPLHDVPAPRPHVTRANPKPYAQGFALYDRYLYTLEGSPYGVADSVAPTGNTYVTCTDLSVPGGRVLASRRLTDGAQLPYREPEGMAVLLPGPADRHPPRLAFGLASVRDGGTRLASIYYKEAR